MEMFEAYKISSYPNEFHPKGMGMLTPSPSYHIIFTNNNQETEINWSINTVTFESEEASKLREILNKIDSILLTSPEFRQLPKQEYEWL